MKDIKNPKFYQSQKDDTQKKFDELKKQVKTDIGEIVDKVFSVLEELESRINEEIDRLATKHIASIEKKENYWCCDERTSEIEKTFKEAHEEFSGCDAVLPSFINVKALDDKLAEDVCEKKFMYSLNLSSTEQVFHKIFHSFKVENYARRALVDDSRPYGYEEKVDKTGKQILHVRKFVEEGDLDGLKSYLDKFPKNIRRYLLESDSFLKAAVQACDFNLVRFFVDDCQLAIGNKLLDIQSGFHFNYKTRKWNPETAEKIATFLVNKQPNLAEKLLSFAIHLNSAELCRLAIDEYQVKIDQPLGGVMNGLTAVFNAAKYRKWDVFEYLCKKGAELSNGIVMRGFLGYHLEDCNILHAVVFERSCDVKFVQHCLWINRNFLYHRNANGQTPIDMALNEKSSSDSIKILMPRVPNVLHVLNKSIVNGSIKGRKQWNRDSLYTYQTLSKAIEYRESKLCKFMQLKWLDWTVRDPSTGMTLLHKAAKIGNLEAVRFLVEHIDVNCRANDGQTPLHLAVFWGHFNITICLRVKNNANVTLKDNKGRSVRYRCEQGIRRDHVDSSDILDLILDESLESLKKFYPDESYAYDSDSEDEDEDLYYGGNQNRDKPEKYEVDDNDDNTSEEEPDFDDEYDDFDDDDDDGDNDI